MSITSEDFESWLITNFGDLPLLQKTHTIQRLYEKLRLIHNAVGDVFQHRATISEFQATYPNVYAKIASELEPYVEGNHLSEQGWNYFLEYMFEPRHRIIIKYVLWVRRRLREVLAETELEPIQ